jgi:hypothetical protein
MVDTASAQKGREIGRHTGEYGPHPLLVLYVVIPAILAVLTAYYLALSRRAAGEFGLPLDDSWIHVRFAENLARGEGFSFNHSQPTSTTTGALWTLLLALAYRLAGEAQACQVASERLAAASSIRRVFSRRREI